MDGLAAATGLLAEARAAGLAVGAEGGELVVEGPRRLGALAERVLAAKPRVLAALAEEDHLTRRVATMQTQIPPTGTIPFLVTRPSEPGPGDCPSCGDPMEPGQQFRCRACAEAARRAVAEDVAERAARRSSGDQP